MKSIMTILATAAVTLHFPAALGQGQAVDASLEAEANQRIDISILRGDIVIRGWDENRVQVSGELSERADGYEFEVRGGVIRFEEDIPNVSRRNFCVFDCDRDDPADSTTLTFSVPRDSVLEFEGVDVELDVTGLENDTEINIVEGRISTADLSGDIELGTVNGDIEANGLNGRIRLSTVEGNITDSGSSGSSVAYSTVQGDIVSDSASPRINAESVNGAIELQPGPVDDLTASVVNGRMVIDLNLNEGGRVELDSVNGMIDLRVDPATLSARFDIGTAVGGSISNNISNDEVVRASRVVNSSELRATLGGGNGSISITTVNGNVTLNPN